MQQKYNISDWLPTTKKEVEKRGWDELDVIIFSGDAYVDHPTFGSAVIGRIIENEGLKVAIVPQPNWQDDLRDFKKLGKPNLFFAVSSGCMDSMVNHYTANKRRRSDDAYTAGGKSKARPDYATTVYSNILKKLFPETPIIIGGIEASLRRFTHYDYWSNQLKPSILEDSKADLLIYGMGEKPLKEILNLLKKNVPFENLKSIPQVAFLNNKKESLPKNKNWDDHYLFGHDICLKEKIKFAKNFKVIEEESNLISSKRLIQNIGEKRVVINPPFPTMSEKDIDSIYELPFTYLPHPKYDKKGNIPAYEMIKHSINIHRGCFGGCSFCTISAHQGKFIVSRSEESIKKELNIITTLDDFKGHITDIGGPSANMYKMKGIHQNICDVCKRYSCIYPKICKNLDTNHTPLANIYKELRQHPDVKKITIGSGVRYDMLFDQNNEIRGDKLTYAENLIEHHVSGRLKVAPEHTQDNVLQVMRKPGFYLFEKFKKLFDSINKKAQLNQQIIPYFISSHPESSEIDMAELSLKIKENDLLVEQIQDFTPTPMTLATVMYYTGINPYTLEKVNIAKSQDQKRRQRSFFFWRKPENKAQIINILKQNKRFDLVKKLFG
jgi:uncharacterized radical SAM protein YgiQ